ncbi:MAG: outer membrane protein [Paraglaciecola sp.]|jgi:outer membrane protein
MMKKSLCIGAIVATIASLPTQADTLLGIYAGAQAWDMNTEGGFSDDGTNIDFNFDDQTKGNFYLALEHPLPLVPNIKIQRSDMNSDGEVSVASSFTFKSELFSANTALTTNIDLVSTDFILYYELFDNDLLSFDLGVNGKHLDGNVFIQDKGDPTTKGDLDFTGILPMLYTKIAFGVPFTGLGAYIEGSFLSVGDHKVTDYQAVVTYSLLDNMVMDTTLQLGFRAMKMELEDLDNLYSNLEFSGAFAGIEVHF